MGGKHCLRCNVKAKHCWTVENKQFVDIPQQCFALLLKVNFPANILNFHWRWRWWDWIQAIFLNLFYFKKRVHRGTLPKQHSRKTYECPNCKKIFTSGNNLDEHIKVKHENNTPEQCDECNRAFGTPHALKAHKYNMHKRSKCEICGQSLCNTFWLKRHMSASHGIRPEGSIPCSHCPLFFSSKGAKDNHVKKQHADLFKVWIIKIFKRKKSQSQNMNKAVRGSLF